MSAIIKVHYYGGTNIARLGSKTASSTSSPEAAARAVAEKAGHGKHVSLISLRQPAMFRYAFQIVSPQPMDEPAERRG